MARWRTQPLPKNWERTRARILGRDAGMCYVCGGLASEIDHIVPVSLGGSDDESNLAAICSRCHRHKTAVESNTRKKSGRRWPGADAHPGKVGGAPRRGGQPDTWHSSSE
jgi:5-methylcytosine-specific restriction protein A